MCADPGGGDRGPAVARLSHRVGQVEGESHRSQAGSCRFQFCRLEVTQGDAIGGLPVDLATVIDVYSRKLVGHTLADHMRASLVIEALSHASKVRGSLKGAIFHSDHGSVYTSQAFQDHCAQFGVRQSMGAVGTSADNALAESFNATLKPEALRDRKVFDSPISCRQEVFRWCMRCNTRRRHSWCNLLVPDDFEALTSATVIQVA